MCRLQLDIISPATWRVDPDKMGMHLVSPTKNALDKPSMRLDDIKSEEINGVFAAQYLAPEEPLD